jgi:hypothetical protein
MRIGIIGCGWIVEKAYLPILEKMYDANVYVMFGINFRKLHASDGVHMVDLIERLYKSVGLE